MAAGWNLTHGELTHRDISNDEYWAHFNYVFSDMCKKTSSYKFGFIKSIINLLFSAIYTSRGMELS